jgi:hypothetical protein
MGAKVYTWTPETELGFLNDELDSLWTQVNTNETDIAALPTQSENDNRYLKLDASNDPITADLEIAHASSPSLTLYDTSDSTYKTQLKQDSADFKILVNGTQKIRYRAADHAVELPIAQSEPGSLLTSSVTFYEDSANEMLWAQWKDDTPTTHHAPIARAKRSVVSLGAGEAVITSGASHVAIGANTDISAVRFPNNATETAIWSFTRPPDWDYGKIQVTVYWMNYDNNVTGNHYWPQRLVGCATGEHTATTQTCATWISGAQTTAGLNDSSKIGETTIAMGTNNTLTGEDFFTYRIQRQGANGADTSGQPWEVVHITVEMIST